MRKSGICPVLLSVGTASAITGTSQGCAIFARSWRHDRQTLLRGSANAPHFLRSWQFLYAQLVGSSGCCVDMSLRPLGVTGNRLASTTIQVHSYHRRGLSSLSGAASSSSLASSSNTGYGGRVYAPQVGQDQPRRSK